MQATISSPNNWLNRIGCKVDPEGKLTLPSNIVLPMTLASEAVEHFRDATSLAEQSKNIQLIAFNTRSADSAFFSGIVDEFHKKRGGELICQHCLRQGVSPSLVQLRRTANKQIIHVMDQGGLRGIHPSFFQIALDYYEELLKLPLLDPNQLMSVTIVPCKNCRKLPDWCNVKEKYLQLLFEREG